MLGVKIPLLLLFWTFVIILFVLLVIVVILIVVVQGSFYYSLFFCQGDNGWFICCMAVLIPMGVMPILMLGGMGLSLQYNSKQFGQWFDHLQSYASETSKCIC